jgi:RNA-directed DNA polymerase
VDKVYKRKNLAMAWEKVCKNRGAGGVDGQSIEEFGQDLERELDRLHEELKQSTYQPQPVREKLIPKAGQPGKYRKLVVCLISNLT